MKPISILDLSYGVLQWTVMTTAFLRVSELKYFYVILSNISYK